MIIHFPLQTEMAEEAETGLYDMNYGRWDDEVYLWILSTSAFKYRLQQAMQEPEIYEHALKLMLKNRSALWFCHNGLPCNQISKYFHGVIDSVARSFEITEYILSVLRLVPAPFGIRNFVANCFEAKRLPIDGECSLSVLGDAFEQFCLRVRSYLTKEDQQEKLCDIIEHRASEWATNARCPDSTLRPVTFGVAFSKIASYLSRRRDHRVWQRSFEKHLNTILAKAFGKVVWQICLHNTPLYREIKSMCMSARRIPDDPAWTETIHAWAEDTGKSKGRKPMERSELEKEC